MRTRKGILVAVFYLLTQGWLKGQDIHFSQIHVSPMFLNPGMTGLMNSDLRFISNIKSQWQFFDKGYQTMLASAEGKLNRGFSHNDDFGIALQVTADKAGDLNFTSGEAALSLSYLKSLNRKGDHLIALGIKYGWNNQYFDLTAVKLLDNDPWLNSSTVTPQISYGDISLGVGWFLPIGRKDNVYLGASLFHLNKFSLSFDVSEQAVPVFAYRKFVVLGGGTHRFSPYLSILLFISEYLTPSFRSV